MVATALMIVGLVSCHSSSDDFGVRVEQQDASQGRETTPDQAGDPGMGDSGPEIPVGRRYVDQDLVLTGFFRPDSVLFHPAERILVPGEQHWVPVPAAADAFTTGTTLGTEGWVKPEQAAGLFEGAKEGAVQPIGVLSGEIVVAVDGRVDVRWVGASEGLLAMRGGRREKGVRALFHAVEADSLEPMEFVINGLPEAKPGSLTIEYSDYVDAHVALQLTIRAPQDGVIVVAGGADGSVVLKPGVLGASDPVDPH